MVLSQLLSRSAVVSLVILLSACATPAPPVREPVPVQVPQPPPVVSPPANAPKAPPKAPPRSGTPSASAALQPLLAKAAQATERGDHAQALALLERAQRIDPGSADVYLGMAQTHQPQGDTDRAKATAERGLLYCATDAQCNALRAYAR